MMSDAVLESIASGLPPGVEGTVATVGTFDGVHRGHQRVLARLAERAADTGWRSLVVTFEPHPLEVVNPAAARPLLSVGLEKFEVLAESGIDYVAVLPFTPTLARYGPDEFIDHVLRARFRMREMLSGYDNGFGRGRSGDVETIRAMGARCLHITAGNSPMTALISLARTVSNDVFFAVSVMTAKSLNGS